MDILKSSLIITVLAFTYSANAKIALDVKWKEKNNVILLHTVCENYNANQRAYRKCRIEAKTVFRKRCQSSRERIENSKKSHRYSKAKSLKKYCDASRNFMILK